MTDSESTFYPLPQGECMIQNYRIVLLMIRWTRTIIIAPLNNSFLGWWGCASTKESPMLTTYDS